MSDAVQNVADKVLAEEQRDSSGCPWYEVVMSQPESCWSRPVLLYCRSMGPGASGTECCSDGHRFVLPRALVARLASSWKLVSDPEVLKKLPRE